MAELAKRFQGREARPEQLRHLVHTGLMKAMEAMRARLEHEGAQVAQVTREREQFSTDIGNSLGVCKDEQKDLKAMITEEPCSAS